MSFSSMPNDVVKKNQVSISSTFSITAFTLVGPKSVKRYWRLDWVLKLWGTTGIKAVRRTLMKSSPGVSRYLTVFFNLPFWIFKYRIWHWHIGIYIGAYTFPSTLLFIFLNICDFQTRKPVFRCNLCIQRILLIFSNISTHFSEKNSHYKKRRTRNQSFKQYFWTYIIVFM